MIKLDQMTALHLAALQFSYHTWHSLEDAARSYQAGYLACQAEHAKAKDQARTYLPALGYVTRQEAIAYLVGRREARRAAKRAALQARIAATDATYRRTLARWQSDSRTWDVTSSSRMIGPHAPDGPARPALVDLWDAACRSVTRHDLALHREARFKDISEAYPGDVSQSRTNNDTWDAVADALPGDGQRHALPCERPYQDCPDESAGYDQSPYVAPASYVPVTSALAEHHERLATLGDHTASASHWDHNRAGAPYGMHWHRQP